jgi:cation diffusion facilitator family transporter
LWSLWSRPPLIGEDSPVTSPARSSDDRALLLSTWTSAGFAVVAVAWGLLTGSQLIVFDGLYSFASVALSLMAVLALRTARRGPDERYPWGREVWEPLTVVVKAAALGGLSVYALVGGVGDVLAGGREVEVGLAVVYGVAATLVGVAVTVVLRRRARAASSDLVAAEAAEWTGDTLLSVGVLAGFIVAAVLQQAGRADLARYVDPVMIVVVSAAFLPVPARLMISGFREVLTMAAPPAVQEPVVALVRTLGAEHGFADVVVRTSKVGGRLDLDVVFLVGADTTVRQCDAVRAELERRLTASGHHVSMSVGFTGDRRWAS